MYTAVAWWWLGLFIIVSQRAWVQIQVWAWFFFSPMWHPNAVCEFSQDNQVCDLCMECSWSNDFFHSYSQGPGQSQSELDFSSLSGKQCSPGKRANNKNFQCWVKWGHWAQAWKILIWHQTLQPQSPIYIRNSIKLVQIGMDFLLRFNGAICSWNNWKGGWYVCKPLWHDGDWLYSSL